MSLPPNLPVPADDGLADHLRGARLPEISLISTTGTPVALDRLDMTVIFIYPRTGTPGKSPGSDWDAIPGARGCTPHSCRFRDLHREFAALKVNVFGMSTQTSAYQLEFAQRVHLPFALLSDHELVLTRALHLPTFEFDPSQIGGGGPSTLIRRMAWFILRGTIEHLWYPVFPPDRNADDVLAWLKAR